MTRTLSAVLRLGLLILVAVATVALPPLARAANVANPTVAEFETAVQERIQRVTEFKFIAAEARKLGVRVYLFGGTAAGYAHYVNWDLRRERGDKRYRPDRFDYDFINIYRSTQDLDIVVDGDSKKAAELQNALIEKYPSFQGSKQQWEVRLLRKDLGDKQALLNNPDFMNQHTDSNSTGLIDLTTEKGEPVVRDLRDWNSRESQFSRDVVESRIHYYFSLTHETTSRARDGLNPAILSVIRLLTKAYQYELEIRPEDEARVRKVIEQFDPTVKLSSYVSSWLEKNASKLVRHAVNIDFAMAELDRIGLRSKLVAIKKDAATVDSMAWWLSRAPLKSSPVGQGSGKTAAELGLKTVAHETNSFLSFESITRSHTNEPNVLVSRTAAAGEAAMYGEGFYTGVGRKGRRGTGWTIRFAVDPNAREGTDFFLASQGDYVIFKNKKALRVIQEDMKVTMPQYYRLLETIDASDRGILEKIRRRLADSLKNPSEKDLAAIKKMILGLEPTANDKSGALAAWLKEPFAAQHLDLIEGLIKRKKFAYQVFVDFLKPNAAATRPLNELAIRTGAIHPNEGILAILEIPGAWNEAELREWTRKAIRLYPEHNLTSRYFSLARHTPEDAAFFTEFVTNYKGTNELMFQRALMAGLVNPGWGRSKDFMAYIRWSFSLSTVGDLASLVTMGNLSKENALALAKFIEEKLPTNHTFFSSLMKPLMQAYEAIGRKFPVAKPLPALHGEHVPKVISALAEGMGGTATLQAFDYLEAQGKLSPAVMATAVRAIDQGDGLRSVVNRLKETNRLNSKAVATAMVERYVSFENGERSHLSHYPDFIEQLENAMKHSSNTAANEAAKISILAFESISFGDKSPPKYMDPETKVKVLDLRLETGLGPESKYDLRSLQMKWSDAIDQPEGRLFTDAEEKLMLEKIVKFSKMPRTDGKAPYTLEMMIEVMTATRLARDPKVRSQLRRALGRPQTDWGGSAQRYLDALDDLKKIPLEQLPHVLTGHSMLVGFMTNLSAVHGKNFAELSEGLKMDFYTDFAFMRAISANPNFVLAEFRFLETLMERTREMRQREGQWMPKQANNIMKALEAYFLRHSSPIAQTASSDMKARDAVRSTTGRTVNLPSSARGRSCQAVFQ